MAGCGLLSPWAGKREVRTELSTRERVLERLEKALNYTLKALKELEDARRLCLTQGYNVYNEQGFSLREYMRRRIDDVASVVEHLLFAIKAIKTAQNPRKGLKDWSSRRAIREAEQVQNPRKGLKAP